MVSFGHLALQGVVFLAWVVAGSKAEGSPADPVVQCPLSGNFTQDNPYPSPCVNPRHLDLNTTQIIFDYINAFSALVGIKDSRVDDHGFPTLQGCAEVTNTDPGQPTYYDFGDIWSRLTNFKFPLLQLVFLTALPALKTKYKFFVLSHLLGNPIDTLQNLLLRFSDCQQRARKWQSYLDHDKPMGIIPHLPSQFKWEMPAFLPISGQHPLPALLSSDLVTGSKAIFRRRERLWKAFTLIVISYDEWDRKMGTDVSEGIKKVLSVANDGGGILPDFIHICLNTAEALAADRFTTSVPILAAQLLFLFITATPFIKIRTERPITPDVYLNIEAYSVAFSLLFFWILLTATLFAVIGVSQSVDRIPRILNRFQSDLRQLQKRICDQNRLLPGHRTLRGLHQARCCKESLDFGEAEPCPHKLEHATLTSEQELCSRRCNDLTQMCETMNSLIDTCISLPITEEKARYLHKTKAPKSEAPSTQRNQIDRRSEVNIFTRNRIYNGGIPSWQPSRWWKGHSTQKDTQAQSDPSDPHNELPPRDTSDQTSIANDTPEEIIILEHGTPRDIGHEISDPVEHDDTVNNMDEESHEIEQDDTLPPTLSFKLFSGLVSSGSIAFSFGMGCLLAWLVPPRGFECRNYCLCIMFGLWFLSWLLKINRPSKWLFLFHYTKDTIVAILISLMIILTQAGILNSCNCYTRHGSVGFPLPQFPSVADQLFADFRTTYAYITFVSAVCFFILFPTCILVWYRHAVQVFLQKDNGEPHFQWVQELRYRRDQQKSWDPRRSSTLPQLSTELAELRQE